MCVQLDGRQTTGSCPERKYKEEKPWSQSIQLEAENLNTYGCTRSLRPEPSRKMPTRETGGDMYEEQKNEGDGWILLHFTFKWNHTSARCAGCKTFFKKILDPKNGVRNS